MELCQGGDLSKNRLKTEDKVRMVVSQILKACSYCHSQGVVHRDLKLENIIFSEPDHSSDVKIIDFGLSATFHTESHYAVGRGGHGAGGLSTSLNKGSPSKHHPRGIKHNKAKRMFLTTCGTAYYMAPEVIEGGYTEACDLWAIGVITFMLLTGRPPFDGADEDEVFDKIEAGRVPFTSAVWQQVGGDARSFVQHLLMVDPRRRWTADQALKSPWMSAFFESERRKSMSGMWDLNF
jgi:calcium-dependent protein kinase